MYDKDNWLIAAVVIFIVAFSLYWFHEKKWCDTKGGMLLRSFDCVKVTYIK
ncbi:hypothetical protein [Burkholderia glumae]|uniref:hypothetical protein n=1 Tax=Burkholderia glumae TaxID=337 RepID=UPI003B9A43C4